MHFKPFCLALRTPMQFVLTGQLPPAVGAQWVVKYIIRCGVGKCRWSQFVWQVVVLKNTGLLHAAGRGYVPVVEPEGMLRQR